MDRSLSILLPVFNSQATLARTVAELLDLLPELTDSFELVIVDDGSTDDTFEIARDLSLTFPQIHVDHSSVRTGMAAALQRGLKRARGEIICLRDESCRCDTPQIEKLWHQMRQHDAVSAHAAEVIDSRLAAWAQRITTRGVGRKITAAAKSPALRMVRRQALERIADDWQNGQDLFQRLTDEGFSCGEIDLEQPSARSNESGSKIPQPNYLARIRDFALGE